MSAFGKTTMFIHAAGIAGVIALSIVGYVAALRPALRATERREEAHQSASQAAKQAATAEAELTDARRKMIQIETDLKSVEVQLIPSGRVNQQIDRLATLAESHQIKLDQLSPGKTTSSRWFSAVPIRMSGTGSFVSCVKFIESVGQRFPDVAVQGLKIDSRWAPGQTAGSSSPKTTGGGGGASENAAVRSAAGTPTPAAFQVEFVWYAAPEASAGAEDTKER